MKGLDMKMVYSVIFLPFLIILLLVTSVNGSSNWVEYGRSNDGTVYLYNKVNIIKDRKKSIVRVWVKNVYSDESREEFIQGWKEDGLSTKGWDKFSHSLGLEEIDCKKKMCRMLYLTVYDTDGSKIDSISFGKPDWSYIVPGIMNDILRKKVCK